MLIRIILILGSIGGLVISVAILVIFLYMFILMGTPAVLNLIDVLACIFVIFCVIFFTMNTYYVLRGDRGHISLYFKRKRLEEEIKIQEAKNRLEALQKKLEEEEKEKK